MGKASKALEHVRPVVKSADQERQELQEARRDMYDLIRELGEVLRLGLSQWAEQCLDYGRRGGSRGMRSAPTGEVMTDTLKPLAARTAASPPNDRRTQGRVCRPRHADGADRSMRSAFAAIAPTQL